MAIGDHPKVDRCGSGCVAATGDEALPQIGSALRARCERAGSSPPRPAARARSNWWRIGPVKLSTRESVDIGARASQGRCGRPRPDAGCARPAERAASGRTGRTPTRTQVRDPRAAACPFGSDFSNSAEAGVDPISGEHTRRGPVAVNHLVRQVRPSRQRRPHPTETRRSCHAPSRLAPSIRDPLADVFQQAVDAVGLGPVHHDNRPLARAQA